MLKKLSIATALTVGLVACVMEPYPQPQQSSQVATERTYSIEEARQQYELEHGLYNPQNQYDSNTVKNPFGYVPMPNMPQQSTTKRQTTGTTTTSHKSSSNNRQSNRFSQGISKQSCGSVPRYCSQMTSCAQARRAYQCGNYNLDRDDDGIPCENVCG